MNTVLLDSQIFCMQRRGGISRYFAEMLARQELFEAAGWSFRTPYRWVMNEQAVKASHHLKRPPMANLERRQLLLPSSYAVSRLHRYDAVHHTYYHPRFLGAFRADATVTTLHDMIPEKYPSMFPDGNPHQAKDQYVASSDALVCVSESTRCDVLEHYGINDDRVFVIPLAPASLFFEKHKPPVPQATPPPYFLYVGPRSGYKNFATLALAVASSRPLRQTIIVAAGGPPFSSQEWQDLIRLGIGHRVQHVVPSDYELRELYRGALAFVCPSHYEGFGLPLIEAMASGCPVVAADRASLPEIAAGAALLFEPDSAEQLGDSLETIATDSGLREALSESGHKRAALYSWERTSALTAAMYANVCA